MYEFRISITGDRIEMTAIKDALAELLRLLKAVEERVALGKGVRWQLATLSYSSPVVIGCIGVPRNRKRNAPDYSELIGRTALAGIRDLERGVRPPDFSDEALEVSRRLASLRGRRGVRDVLLMDENGATPTPLSLTPRTLAAVEDFIGVKSESFGSVDGRLEVVSAHGGITCSIYESLTGKAVRCEVPEELRRKVLDAFEGRVIATGIVRRDASGQPRVLALHDLTRVESGTEEFVSLAGIAPDFTDGVDSAEYIKGRWR